MRGKSGVGSVWVRQRVQGRQSQGLLQCNKAEWCGTVQGRGSGCAWFYNWIEKRWCVVHPCVHACAVVLVVAKGQADALRHAVVL